MFSYSHVDILIKKKKEDGVLFFAPVLMRNYEFSMENKCRKSVCVLISNLVGVAA
jgi:hypothetical protein